MAFADYTDGENAVKALRWDGLDETAGDAINQIPGISVHLNTVGDAQIKELRFNNYLTIPEGDWVVVSVTADSIMARRMSDGLFTATYTLTYHD